MYCCVTDDRSPVTGHYGSGTVSDSPSPVSDESDAGLLDSHEVYNSSAGQLITIVSVPAASASQSL